MKKICTILVCCIAIVMISSCGKNSSDELTVMTFNMRYDTPRDGENRWTYRYDRIAQVILAQDADLFGAQEVTKHMLDTLVSRLAGYTYVGVGRGDGIAAGEFSPVFYKKDRFELLDSGNFWLSETPDVAGSKGWDAACKRIASWVILKDRRKGNELFMLNTHLDHVGEVARRESVKLLLQRVKELRGDRPAILTGDFNAMPDSEVITSLLADGSVFHTRDIAATTNGTLWTFSAFGQLPDDKRTFIDYVFVTSEWEVASHVVLPDTLDGEYVSDHTPIVTKLTIAR